MNYTAEISEAINELKYIILTKENELGSENINTKK